MSCEEEIYPAEPNPSTVDARLLASPILLTKPLVPKPMTVDANSVGSIKLEMYVVRPVTDETS